MFQLTKPDAYPSIPYTPTVIPYTPAVVESYVDESYVDESYVKTTSQLPLCIVKIIGLAKDLQFILGTFISRFKYSANYEKVIGNPDQAKGIAVLIHGLNAHPSQMDGHAEALRKKLGDDVLIYQVRVVKKGNCSKIEAMKEIENKVLPILSKYPKMKLYAHGISNGGLLASKLAEAALQQGVEGNRILVSANASPLFGTKIMGDPTSAAWKQRIWKKIMQSPLAGSHAPIVVKELTWGSNAGREMISNIRESAKQGVHFEFDGSFADSKVTPPSFYPKDDQRAQYFHPEGIEGHSSIISSQRSRQVQSAVDFITEPKNK